MKIALIGGGTMGEAIIKSLLRKKLVNKNEITACDVATDRREYLKKKYGLNVTDNNIAGVKRADVIVLAIKPHEMDHVLGQLVGQLKAQLVISIAAGVTLESLCSKLNYSQVVRAMPNTPAQVGRGMTAWIGAKKITNANMDTARSIIKSLGEEQYFTDEKYINMATAISGSGPAYVFLIIESLIDAGVHIGLPRNVAQKLVIETITGSVEVMKKMDRHPAELRNMVTSPGGTTTEALYKLEIGGLRSLLISAVDAAYTRARELGGK
ncbi:MAG: pyrroline-5-carboxylate reductase [Dehalococcoidia bacterium]|nr:pyrroline-5-carboxylate reductase [Dehalococcoidia bacterium]